MSTPSVEQAFAVLRDRTIADSQQILLKQVLDASMPPGVKRYLLAEVVSLLARDLDTLPHFGRLHPDAPGIADLRLAFLRSLAGGYDITRDEYLTLLKEAVAFTESYLTRPRWTLESFLFEDQQEISLETLQTRFAYCADYGYLGRVLEEILLRRNATGVSRADFRTLLARIDYQVVQQHSPAEFAMLAKPLFDFLLLKDAGLDELVPLAPILEFLEDKKLTIVREYVESISRLREMKGLSLRQLRQLMEDLASAGREGDTEKKPAGEPAATAAPVTANTAPAPPATEAEHPPPLPPERPGPEALPNLRSLIGEKQRQRFIRHVFNKDQAYFFGVIATLNTLRTWEEAATYLKQVYVINRLDPFDAPVVEFTDIVQQRFAGTTDTTG
jgi:hypothetical protein